MNMATSSAFNTNTQNKPAPTSENYEHPICLIVLGMAGSGKTTFVKKLSQLNYEVYKPYVINLDPGCRVVPYNANIDIRDTVNYKEVMKQYKLGPNGGIVTSLNLFCTKFADVLELIIKAGKDGHKLCIIDTPGQIEVFTWSASGTVITEALATAFPTMVVYLMDTVRSTVPTTFMSNMLYACSILYRARLPFIVAFNKIDVQEHDFALEWMTDFEAFLEALETEKTYVGSLGRTMCLTMDEFYSGLKACGVSAKSGVGFSHFYDLVSEGVKEYHSDFKTEYDQLRKEKLDEINKKLEEQLKKSAVMTGTGEEVPMTSELVTEVPAGRNLADIYLRHPGNESSEDEEGTEEGPLRPGNDEVEDQNFHDFLQKRKESQADKASKMSSK